MIGLPRLGLRTVAGCFLLAAAFPAGAASCSVNSQGVIFGGYDTLNPSPHDGVGNVGVACDAVTSFTVSLSAGGGSIQDREMAGGAAQLHYNLYTDASRTVLWGDGIVGGTVSTTADAVDLPVFGRIPARQTVPAGAYGDTIVITVSY